MSNLSEALADALLNTDIEHLEYLSNTFEGFPVGCDPESGEPWILLAIAAAPTQTLKWLLEKKPNLNFSHIGYSPLHLALEREMPDIYEIFEILIKFGAPLNIKGINDYTPAHKAAMQNDVEALKILAKYGADFSIRTTIDDYATPLEEATKFKRTAAAEFLRLHT